MVIGAAALLPWILKVPGAASGENGSAFDTGVANAEAGGSQAGAGEVMAAEIEPL